MPSRSDKIDEINRLDGRSGRMARYSFAGSFIMRYLYERLAYFSPSNDFRVSCYRKMGVNIGKGVFIGNYVIFDRIFPGRISIGDDTSIGDRCIITAHANIPSKTPLKNIYPRTVKTTKIGKGIWIMPNCVIAPGTTIGDYSVIATGAIITKDIPPLVLAGGIPAKPLKDLLPQMEKFIAKSELIRLKRLRTEQKYEPNP